MLRESLHFLVGWSLMAKESTPFNLLDLTDRFHVDAKSRDCIKSVRWPGGKVVCPRCGCDRASDLTARPQFDCFACRYQFSVTPGNHYA